MTKPNVEQQVEEAPVVTLCTNSVDEAAAQMHAHTEFPWEGCPDRSLRSTYLECQAQEIIDKNGWDMHRNELLAAASALMFGTRLYLPGR